MDHTPITIPLTRFLELFFGSKDKVVLGTEDIVYTELLKVRESLPNPEALFHIQTAQEKSNFNPGYSGLVVVWQPRDWQHDQEKYLQEKRESEEYNRKWELRKGVVEEVCKSIASKTGLEPNHPAVLGIAKKIFDSRNQALADAYGVKLPEEDELKVGKYSIREQI